MVKRTAFGKGPSGPSPEELEREAAAELRRAMAGSEPRPQARGRGGRAEWTPPPPEPESEEELDEFEELEGPAPDWMPGLTAEEERRAITDLAMRQLTERPGGSIRPEDTLVSINTTHDAENMRNKALADFMARQQQMAKDRPAPGAAPGSRAGRGGPPVVQKTSGWTISPNLTTKPTMTGGPSGFSPELEEQAGMSRLKVDRNSRESRAARERPLRAGDTPSGHQDDGDWNRPLKPRRKASAGPGAPAVAAVPAIAEERAAPDVAPGPSRAGKASAVAAVAPGSRDGRAPAVGAAPVAPGSRAGKAPAVGAAPDSPAGKAPAVRNRSVQRRAATRIAAATEPEARWRVLAELADLLAEEVFPGDTLPEVCRWLAGTINATVAILLLADDAIDDLSAWPADDPLVGYLNDLVGEPLDEQSTIWAAVSDGRTIAGGPGDEPLVLPDGAADEDLGGWAVLPVIDRTVAFGTILVTRPHGDALPDATISLVEEVAKRVARALLNCEEAASNGDSADREDSSTGGGASDQDVPPPIRDRLGALSFVLGVIDSPPRPRLAPEQNRRYDEIVAHAAALQTEVTEFLNGHEA